MLWFLITQHYHYLERVAAYDHQTRHPCGSLAGVSTAAEILASTEIGTVRYIAGRPASGVTTTLVEIANLAVADGRSVLFLTAEASPEQLRAHYSLSPGADALDVVGMNDDGLADLIDEHASSDGLVCLDHLGLIKIAVGADLPGWTRCNRVVTIAGVPLGRDATPMVRAPLDGVLTRI